MASTTTGPDGLKISEGVWAPKNPWTSASIYLSGPDGELGKITPGCGVLCLSSDAVRLSHPSLARSPVHEVFANPPPLFSHSVTDVASGHLVFTGVLPSIVTQYLF